jgi:hypothetical protein
MGPVVGPRVQGLGCEVWDSVVGRHIQNLNRRFRRFATEGERIVLQYTCSVAQVQLHLSDTGLSGETYFTKICSGSEEGSYSRLRDL